MNISGIRPEVVIDTGLQRKRHQWDRCNSASTATQITPGYVSVSGTVTLQAALN